MVMVMRHHVHPEPPTTLLNSTAFAVVRGRNLPFIGTVWSVWERLHILQQPNKAASLAKPWPRQVGISGARFDIFPCVFPHFPSIRLGQYRHMKRNFCTVLVRYRGAHLKANQIRDDVLSQPKRSAWEICASNAGLISKQPGSSEIREI